MSRFAVYLRLYILILRLLRDLNIVYEKKKSVFSKVKDLKVSTFIEHCKETQNTHHTVITAPLWGTKTLTVDLDHFLIVHTRKFTDVVRRESGLFLNMMPQPRTASRFLRQSSSSFSTSRLLGISLTTQPASLCHQIY